MLAERAREMRGGGIDGDDHIELGDDRRRIGEIFDVGAEINRCSRCGHTNATRFAPTSLYLSTGK